MAKFSPKMSKPAQKIGELPSKSYSWEKVRDISSKSYCWSLNLLGTRCPGAATICSSGHRDVIWVFQCSDMEECHIRSNMSIVTTSDKSRVISQEILVTSEK